MFELSWLKPHLSIDWRRAEATRASATSFDFKSIVSIIEVLDKNRSMLTRVTSEKKIDLIEDRLGGIEKSLRELLISSRVSTAHGLASEKLAGSSHPPRSLGLNAAGSTSVKPAYTGSRGPGYTSNPTIEQHDSSSVFEGEGNSSLAAHSAYAREFLESAVSHSTPEVLSSPKISEALSSLRQIVAMQNKRHSLDKRGQLSSKGSRLGVRCDIRDLEMPPLPLVLSVLRKIKENPPSSFGGYIPFFSVDYFVEKCHEVYFCTAYSDATFIATNFGLYNIFIELGFIEKDPASRDEFLKCLGLCKDNLEAALANLNILMPATYDYIVSLTLGAIHGIEISKPSVGWTLASTAIQMCQTLGYHRLSSMENDPPEVQLEKQVLFWSCYTVLNMMSLRLGRASVIQDHEIGIPVPSESFTSSPSIWGSVCALWTLQSIIQNKIYILLYSPAALKNPESERVAHARNLAVEMQSTIIKPFERLMSSGITLLSDADVVYLQSDKVSRLSILTLIYRAIPARDVSNSPSSFIPECIETAREALEHHQVCMTALKESSVASKCSYMHWAIFIAPFVPFIVIFCHVIATSDGKDLSLLEDFIASLRPLCSFSQSVDRLHNLCSVLGSVARLYVEAKTRSQAGQDQSLVSVGQEFDVYLSALGLAPGFSQGYPQDDIPPLQSIPPDSSSQMAGLASTVLPQGLNQDSATVDMSQAAQAAQLGNWFSGNQYMMNLLEEDFFQFNDSN
ncbi:hypothetical protein N7495_001135 [Penicillium taxi]|uniref:uncharacterized protein n=1 Tax=Penicillium taxi TaxID=168475 RepID=UPI002545AB44|nr:uncharacterized protein N7495_001135 [Penicillium taxi]KAJ5908453.1 hypothetical protein N7495_001135 [Penicillium taxi]